MGERTQKELRPVWGAKAIGEVVGKTERQAFHLLENKLLPGRKIGNQWVSEMGQLEAAIRGILGTA